MFKLKQSFLRLAISQRMKLIAPTLLNAINHYILLICRYYCIMMSLLTSKANCDVITNAYGCQDSCGISYIAEKFERKQVRHFG